SSDEVAPERESELTSPTSSDLWRTVETAPSPHTVDIADFHAGESGENQQPYRALLIVTDGTAPGAETISITWPVDDENEWVPLAYAGGAAVAVSAWCSWWSPSAPVAAGSSPSPPGRRMPSRSSRASQGTMSRASRGTISPAPAAPTTPRSSTRSTKPVPARRSPDE